MGLVVLLDPDNEAADAFHKTHNTLLSPSHCIKPRQYISPGHHAKYDLTGLDPFVFASSRIPIPAKPLKPDQSMPPRYKTKQGLLLDKISSLVPILGVDKGAYIMRTHYKLSRTMKPTRRLS